MEAVSYVENEPKLKSVAILFTQLRAKTSTTRTATVMA
jgi:hypothetical protein